MPVQKIRLSNSQQTALIDSRDAPRISGYIWRVDKRKHTYYAVAYSAKNYSEKVNYQVYLHRIIMDAQPGQQIDHINGDGLDCRRENMRFCTSTQNRQNRRKTIGASKYKGVSLRRGRWRAYIGVEKKHIELGAFSSEYEAAREYDRAAVKFFGPFAKLNFGPQSYEIDPVGPVPCCGAALRKKGDSWEIGWSTRHDAEEFLQLLTYILEKECAAQPRANNKD